MKNNITLPLGSISLLDKIEKDIGFISGIFGNTRGKSKNFIGIIKLFISNRIEDTVSVHLQIFSSQGMNTNGATMVEMNLETVRNPRIYSL